MLPEPKDVEYLVEESKRDTKSLRDRWLFDLKLVDADPFSLDHKEGNWQDVTTGLPGIISNKITGLLANGRSIFSFKLESSKQNERDRLSKTERFVYAAYEKANNQFRSPFTPSTIHDAMSWVAPNMGWLIPCVFVHVDKEGEVKFDFRVYNPYVTYFGYDGNGLAWLANEKWISREEAEKQYPKAKIGSERDIYAIEYINTEEEGVIIQGDWATAPYHHGLGRVPALVQPAGARMLMQGYKTRNDTDLARLGESFIAPVRHLFARRSEAMTYYMTALAEEAREARYGYYDSTKKGEAPEKLDQHPDVRGSFTWLDRGLGQEIAPRDYRGMSGQAKVVFDIISAEISQATLSPISFGYLEPNTPATAVAMALQSDTHAILPYRKLIEACEQWGAMEMIRQYKEVSENDDIEEWEAVGFDDKGKRFNEKVKPEDLEDEKEITCEISMRSMWDDLQNAGIMVTLADKEIISRQTARDNLRGLVPDTDAEQGRVFREKAMNLPGVIERLMVSELLEDKKGLKDPETRRLVNMLTNRIMMLDSQEQQAATRMPVGGQGEEEAQPPILPNGQRISPELQTRIRLSNIGLNYAQR